MRYKVGNVKDCSDTRGWICGYFYPENSLQKSSQLEVKYDILNPGDTQAPHRHPFGTEVVVIIKEKVKH